VPVLQIAASNPGAAGATLTGLQLAASGSGDDATGVSNVSLYLDNNGNGLVDASDSLLAGGTYPSNNGTLTLNFTAVVGPASTAHLLVAYNFSGSASGTYQANLLNNNSLWGTGGNGQPLNFMGAPLSGALLTAAVSTATPTPTATSFVPTPSQTSTATAVSTTPMGSTPTAVIYPNPATGPGPVTILITLPEASENVRVLVFTTAFRRINEIQLGSVPAGVSPVTLALTDRWGVPLANGIYYVVVRAGQSRTVTKLMVMR
jgi:hypothetical protein